MLYNNVVISYVVFALPTLAAKADTNQKSTSQIGRFAVLKAQFMALSANDRPKGDH